MKTAVSLPDPLFEAADGLAQELGISRSELYARALAAFLKAHDQGTVTQALDRVYAEEDSVLEPALVHLQSAAISREDW